MAAPAEPGTAVSGGGASGVSLGSNFSAPAIVAGGGGGGGAGSYDGGGAGGSAGTPAGQAGVNGGGAGGGGGNNTTGEGAGGGGDIPSCNGQGGGQSGSAGPGPAIVHTVLLRPGPDRHRFARRHLDLRRAGTVHVATSPGARGVQQVRHHRRPLRINLWVTYQPRGGTPQTRAFLGLLVPTRRPKPAAAPP